MIAGKFLEIDQGIWIFAFDRKVFSHKHVNETRKREQPDTHVHYRTLRKSLDIACTVTYSYDYEHNTHQTDAHTHTAPWYIRHLASGVGLAGGTDI